MRHFLFGIRSLIDQAKTIRETREFFQELNRLINEGELEKLSMLFEEPLPIYSEAGLFLRATREDTARSLEVLLEAAGKRGFTHMTHRIVSIAPRPNWRASFAQLEWQYRDAQKTIIARSFINYYVGATEGEGYKILMMDYLQPGIPEALSVIPRDDTPRTIN